MTPLKDRLDWPSEAFCSDRTLAGGAAMVGFCDDGREVCLQSFMGKVPNLATPLSSLISEGDSLQFSSALARVPNRRLSIFTIRGLVDRLMVFLMVLTGKSHEIKYNIFDVSLRSYRNPGSREDFPFDKPLKVAEAQFRIVMGTTNPYIRLTEPTNERAWQLSLEVFSQVQHISVSSAQAV